nr:hypothetical protein Iba_chr02cCG13160 [Ipomoea batatas]GMC65263.1 hypothetical protein Iba_chr02dCG12540 [Ipomoea batatas]GMD67362.1 hypothetical protein Iba_scaffold1494007CG0010 [Ipomoea batatas]GME12788.1 hypothetical protein Iba_scaffold14126CG0010 [Ipomoea batatas]
MNSPSNQYIVVVVQNDRKIISFRSTIAD